MIIKNRTVERAHQTTNNQPAPRTLVLRMNARLFFGNSNALTRAPGVREDLPVRFEGYFREIQSGIVLKWWNWYTRTTQNRMPQGLRVRLPLEALI